MSEEERVDPPPVDAADEEEEDGSSPFDHPLFLPVLLFALTVWFGFDGWFNESIESVRFNRYGFFVLLGAAAYFFAVDNAKIRFLLPALFLGYAAWLGLFALFGADDAWWRNAESARLFNRYGALVCAVLAAIAWVLELRRGPREEAAPTS